MLTLHAEGVDTRFLTLLNRGEGRHTVVRVIFHGQRGELRQHYRERQEDQLGALELVLNAVILWNTTYTQDALEALRATSKEMLAAGQHRALRTPDQPDDEP